MNKTIKAMLFSLTLSFGLSSVNANWLSKFINFLTAHQVSAEYSDMVKRGVKSSTDSMTVAETAACFSPAIPASHKPVSAEYLNMVKRSLKSKTAAEYGACFFPDTPASHKPVSADNATKDIQRTAWIPFSMR